MASIPAGKVISSLCDGWSWWWCQFNSEEADGKDFTIQAIVTLSVITIAIITYLLLSKRSSATKEGELLPLPPGPRGLPLVGNLPFLEPDLHKYFSKLAQIYGPIFKLQLGNKKCVVVSSSSLAKQILKDHDSTFANHNPPIAALIISYGGSDILWRPHGPDWRILSKVFVREMMSNASLDLCYDLCRQEIEQMLREVYSKIGTQIDIGELVFVTLLDMVMNMLWGGTLKGEEKTRIGLEFKKMIGELVALLGKTNVSDIFPILACFDLQGIERKAKKVLSWADTILDLVIEERIKMVAIQQKKRSKDDDVGSKDFLEILLDLSKQQGDGKATLSMEQIKALLLVIVSAGTDTTTTTLEWAFAEMMRKPYIMRKAQKELGQVVGMSNTVEESHISKLPYLNAVLKETLRLHPVLPLLVPHCPSQSCTIGQFTIPKGADVFLNIWKIHRDPEAWEGPLEFLPERFLKEKNEYDYKGNNFNYLPFGSGRRICAGIPLAEIMATYMLASLLHSFEWRLPENVELDLSEEFGILLKKRIPLVIIPTPRLSNVELYN